MNAGLTEVQASEALARVGYNEIEQKPESLASMLKGWFLSPASLMMEFALALSLWAGRFVDAGVIFFLLLINVGLSAYHQSSAQGAIDALRKELRVFCRVIRDGKSRRIAASEIVPGDVVSLQRGDVVPADAEVIEAQDVSVDESMLTGESLPVGKLKGDRLYSTAIVRSGKALACITQTGNRTYFGKTLQLIDTSEKKGALEKDVMNITRFLIVTGLAALAILGIFFALKGKPLLDVAELAVGIAISSFPVALPTVITLVTSLGVLELSRKKIVVRRLAALDDLANVDLLLTDKTGTLTKNLVRVTEVVSYEGTEDQLLRQAACCSDADDPDVIDAALLEEASRRYLSGWTQTQWTPASSESKMARAEGFLDGKKIVVIKGDVRTVVGRCALDEDQVSRVDADLKAYSSKGFKVLAVAFLSGKAFRLSGLVLLSDPPRADAGESIEDLRQNGVQVKMLTGDNRYAALEVCEELGLGSRVLSKDGLSGYSKSTIDSYDGFAELYPKDKYDLVRSAREGHVVAVTGDGVNDIPAMKEADVGIAVENAVDAAKTSADIVLLSPGIRVVKDALISGRQILEKIQYYSVYRISESLRVILTILVLGLWLGDYPLAPLQLILLSILNDVPIIAIAFDHVKPSLTAQRIDFKKRTALSCALGLVGVFNSVLMVVLALNVFHLDIGSLQSLFFLKLSFGGHLLLLVVRTKKTWFKDLPSPTLAAAILLTQAVAAGLVYFGIFMPHLPLFWIGFIFLYTLFWMQVSEWTKQISQSWLKSVA